MGCDIHSFVLVRDKEKYVPITMYEPQINTHDDGNQSVSYSNVQPWSGRNYTFFGTLTAGAVRGDGLEGLELPLRGRFDKHKIEWFLDQENIDKCNQLETRFDLKPIEPVVVSPITRTMIHYYNNEYFHSHSYATVAEFVKLKKKAKKIVKQYRRKLDDPNHKLNPIGDLDDNGMEWVNDQVLLSEIIDLYQDVIEHLKQWITIARGMAYSHKWYDVVSDEDIIICFAFDS